MTPTVKKYLIAGGVVSALAVGVYLLDGHYSKKVMDQQAIAQEAVGKAAQLETEAKNAKKDAQIAEDTAEVISQKLVRTEADVKRLKQRVSELASVPQSVVTVGGEVTPEHAALDQAKDEYIGSLENETQSQKELISSLETAVDKWKLSSNNFESALEEERRARRAGQIASSAALKGVRVARWRGRLEGFLVGVGAGYVKGRM